MPPGDGVTLADHHFSPGVVLSVPTYAMHHSKDTWGEDADEFQPERWETMTEMCVVDHTTITFPV